MRVLLLARHAKSDWDDPTLPDRDRPLTARGRRAANALGLALGTFAPAPMRIVTSPAVRAHDTARRALEAMALPAVLDVDRRMYPGEPDQLAAVIADADDADDPLMLVAHQPGLQTFALDLAHTDDPLRPRLLSEFPTSVLVALAFPASRWLDVAPGTGRIVVAGVADRLVGPA